MRNGVLNSLVAAEFGGKVPRLPGIELNFAS